VRNLAIAFFALHGVAHLAGATSLLRSFGESILWTMLAAGWWALAIGTRLRASWWLLGLEALVALSIAFCVWRWPEAKWGVLANLAALAFGYAYLRYPGEAGMAIRSPQLEELWAQPGKAVRLRMHGEIKLGQWYPFRAEQVLRESNEFVWAATVSLAGVPIRGSDSYVKGAGAMEWKLLDLWPVARAAGPDVSRSARQRMEAEQAIWLRAGERVNDQQIAFLRWGNPKGKEFREEMFGVFFDETRATGSKVIPSKIRAGWYFGTSRFETEGEFFRATVEEAEWK